MKPSFDFDEKPFLVIWETTHACDLACVHCRAEAQPVRDPQELSYSESLRLIKEIHGIGTPILVFSGGDPLKRGDLKDLIYYAKSLGLRTGAIPAVTPSLTKEKLLELKASGLDQVAFSLDAATAAQHDAFRRVEGVFDRTLERVRWANEAGMHVQINSLVNVHNLEKLDELIALIETLDIVFWEVFFLVPMGRGREVPLLSAQKFEEAFEKLYQVNRRAKFVVKVTEAPQYRRYFAEKEKNEPKNVPGISKAMPAFLKRSLGPSGSIGHAPQGVNSGKGFLFISYKGDIFPSGFLPIKAGNVREDSLREIYRESPLFKELRDPLLLKGRCGVCDYKDICGGSRSRAYAVTGDYLAEDPCCAYVPQGMETAGV